MLPNFTEILELNGFNSFSYSSQSLSCWQSRQEASFIAYEDRGNFRLALAPIANFASLSSVVDEFLHFSKGKRVCFFGVQDRFKNAVKSKVPISYLKIGVQPVWKIEQLLEAYKKPSLKYQLQRCENKKITFAVWGIDQIIKNKSELISCYQSWQQKKGPQLSFLLSNPFEKELSGKLVVVAQKENAIVGFLILAPIPARQAWLVESTIRENKSVNGITESMIYHAVTHLYEHNYESITLGLCPWFKAESTTIKKNQSLHWGAKLLLFGIQKIGPLFYDHEGIGLFRQKIPNAEWEPVYLANCAKQVTPLALLSIGRVITGGFRQYFKKYVLWILENKKRQK